MHCMKSSHRQQRCCARRVRLRGVENSCTWEKKCEQWCTWYVCTNYERLPAGGRKAQIAQPGPWWQIGFGPMYVRASVKLHRARRTWRSAARRRGSCVLTIFHVLLASDCAHRTIIQAARKGQQTGAFRKQLALEITCSLPLFDTTSTWHENHHLAPACAQCVMRE